MTRRPKRKRTAPWKRRQRRTLLVVTVALVVIGGALSYRISVSNQIAVEYEKIRAQGLPVSPEELRDWFESAPASLEDSQLNAQAIAAVKTWVGNTEKLLAYEKIRIAYADENLIDSDATVHLNELLRENEEALALLHQAATTGPTRSLLQFPMEYLYVLDLSHLEKVIDAVELLVWGMIVTARDGDYEGSMRSMQAAWHVAESLAFDPSVVSQLAQAKGHVMVYDALAFLLGEAPLPKDYLLGAEEIIKTFDPVEGIQRGLIGERCMALQAFDRGFHDNDIARKLFAGIGFVEFDRAAYISLIADIIEGVAVDSYEAQPIWDGLREEIEELPNIRALITKILIPGLARLRNAVANAQAERNLILSVLAIERLRLGEKALPDLLTELVPTYLETVPIDPFDGASVRFERTDKGYIVYSIGQNEKDDGGVVNYKRTTQGDRVIRIER